MSPSIKTHSKPNLSPSLLLADMAFLSPSGNLYARLPKKLKRLSRDLPADIEIDFEGKVVRKIWQGGGLFPQPWMGGSLDGRYFS